MTVRIHSVKAGHGLSRRLAAMGLLPGVELTVLKHHPGGPTMIMAKVTRLILGRGVADKVMVY
jgi:Fe2+ transport system protein FeoA